MSTSDVWFITGASSGIGASIARAALKAGHRVVATSRHIDKLRSALGAPTDRLELLALDVGDASQVARVVDAAVAKFGRLDVVVNNAGYSLLGHFETISPDQLAQLFRTNFDGVVHVLRAALPALRRQRSGRVFNVSSLAGLVGFEACSAYAATKFAMEGLSLSIGKEVERFGIHVTLVEPGFFRTDLLAPQAAMYGELAVADYGAPSDVRDTWSKYHGTQSGDPDKLAAALLVLAVMDAPPAQFLAGGDAVAAITASLEARLAEIRTHAALSQSM